MCEIPAGRARRAPRLRDRGPGDGAPLRGLLGRADLGGEHGGERPGAHLGQRDDPVRAEPPLASARVLTRRELDLVGHGEQLRRIEAGRRRAQQLERGAVDVRGARAAVRELEEQVARRVRIRGDGALEDGDREGRVVVLVCQGAQRLSEPRGRAQDVEHPARDLPALRWVEPEQHRERVEDQRRALVRGVRLREHPGERLGDPRGVGAELAPSEQLAHRPSIARREREPAVGPREGELVLADRLEAHRERVAEPRARHDEAERALDGRRGLAPSGGRRYGGEDRSGARAGRVQVERDLRLASRLDDAAAAPEGVRRGRVQERGRVALCAARQRDERPRLALGVARADARQEHMARAERACVREVEERDELVVSGPARAQRGQLEPDADVVAATERRLEPRPQHALVEVGSRAGRRIALEAQREGARGARVLRLGATQASERLEDALLRRGALAEQASQLAERVDPALARRALTRRADGALRSCDLVLSNTQRGLDARPVVRRRVSVRRLERPRTRQRPVRQPRVVEGLRERHELDGEAGEGQLRGVLLAALAAQDPDERLRQRLAVPIVLRELAERVERGRLRGVRHGGLDPGNDEPIVGR